MIKDILAGAGSSAPCHLSYAAGKLWFSADNGTTGYEPWVSDGTLAGTHLVADLRPGALGSDPTEFTEASGYTIFAANNGTTGRELWQSTGTAAGTQVMDITPGAQSTYPHALVRWNESILYLTGSAVATTNAPPTPLEETQVSVFTPDPTPGWTAWQAANLGANASPVISGPKSDPDKDGCDNFAEYAFGSGAQNGASQPNLLRLASPAGQLGFCLTARQDTALDFTIECSSNLAIWTKYHFKYNANSTWTSATLGLTIISAQPQPDGTSLLKVYFPQPSGSKCFGRVSVSAP
jgi:ELWxxDGT repeat protein